MMAKRRKPGPVAKKANSPMMFSLPEEMKERIRQIAALEGRTPALLFKRAMSFYCKKMGHEWSFDGSPTAKKPTAPVRGKKSV